VLEGTSISVGINLVGYAVIVTIPAGVAVSIAVLESTCPKSHAVSKNKQPE
jgi:hypothetical protein